MHIAVNLHAYFHNGIGGLGTVVRVLLAGLARRHRLTVFARLEEFGNIRPFAPEAELRPVDELEAAVRPGAFDLLFCPLLMLEPPEPGIPSAVLIPDVQHEYFPEYFTPEILEWRRQNYQDSAAVADVIFTVSEYSKRTIAAHLGVEPERIVVLDHGVEDDFDCPADDKTRDEVDSLGLGRDYLLFPGAFWPHKNHSNLLRALRILVDTGHPDLELALTGEHHFGAERIRAEIEGLGLAPHVRLLGFQPRAVLAELYRRAAALVFVSRFEGFGMPVLEAFHAGVPVVASRIDACVEVAGGAACLVDERDPAGIAAGIDRVLKDTELRRRLVDLGRLRMARYSWEHTMAQVNEAIERMLLACGQGYSPRRRTRDAEIRQLGAQLEEARRRLEEQSREIAALSTQVIELRQREADAVGRAAAAFRRLAGGRK